MTIINTPVINAGVFHYGGYYMKLKVKIIIFIITALAAIIAMTSCKGGLTREETRIVFTAWNLRTTDLHQAIDQGVFSKDYIESMKARDNEVEPLLLKGIKK